MSNPSLAEVLPTPDADTVRRLLGLLGSHRPQPDERPAADSKTA